MSQSRKQAALIVGGALLGIGWLVPAAVLDDGLNGLDRRESVAARRALRLAPVGCLDNPAQRAVTQRIRVIAVRRAGRRTYRVVLRAHTFFGIPIRRITVEDGVMNCGM